VAIELFIDGAPATFEDLTHPALVTYGAYTSFAVRDGAVRGLDLHLARLETAAVELFGEAVGEEALRAFMRAALGDRATAFLRVSLFSPNIGHRHPSFVGRPRVMVGVFDMPPPLDGGRRVLPVQHRRETPHLKHASTMGLIRARREADGAGFDDALLVDGELILEGSIWNLGLVRGSEVTWPEGPRLAGVTERLIDAGLAGQGLTSRRTEVRLDDLDGYNIAFLCNAATPAASITRIGDRSFAADDAMIARLEAAWAATAPQKI
jgi:branched-subunit amino acid aminotransferase/4-amino-4-deoxychorismate lyase